MEMTTVDSILERASAGDPLTAGDLAALLAARDILALGMAADERRRRGRGARATFVRVAPVTVAEASAWARPPAATEVRISGPVDPVDAAVTAVRAVRAAAGDLPFGGFSLADLEAVAAGDASRLAETLAALRAAGLEFIADAPLDRLRDPIGLLEAASRAGLTVPRLTTDLAPADPVAWLGRARDLASRFPSIVAVAPLARRAGTVPSTGYEDVKLVALARLALPDAVAIQVDWAIYGPKLAQVALGFGADDLDNVSPRDDEGEGRRRAPLEEVRRNVAAAGLEPVLRDGRFAPAA